MSILRDTNYAHEVAAGRVPGAERVEIRGLITDLGVTIQDISCVGGVFSWPTSPGTIVARSNSANDDVAGTGARTIEVLALLSDFTRVLIDISLVGNTVSSSSAESVIRILASRVKTTGTYSTSTTGGNADEILIEFTSGQVLACIANENGKSVGTDARYTVPAGKMLLIRSFAYQIASNKVGNLAFWVRDGADITTAPFSSKLEAIEFHDLEGGSLEPVPIDPPFRLNEKTDFWASGSLSSGTGGIIEVIFFGILEDMPS